MSLAGFVFVKGLSQQDRQPEAGQHKDDADGNAHCLRHGVPALRGVWLQPPNFLIAAMTHVTSSRPRAAQHRIRRMSFAVLVSVLVSIEGVGSDMTFSFARSADGKISRRNRGGTIDAKKLVYDR